MKKLQNFYFKKEKTRIKEQTPRTKGSQGKEEKTRIKEETSRTKGSQGKEEASRRKGSQTT